MMTGLSTSSERLMVSPHAARLSAESGRRPIAAWTAGPSSIISSKLAARGSHWRKMFRIALLQGLVGADRNSRRAGTPRAPALPSESTEAQWRRGRSMTSRFCGSSVTLSLRPAITQARAIASSLPVTACGPSLSATELPKAMRLRTR